MGRADEALLCRLGERGPWTALALTLVLFAVRSHPGFLGRRRGVPL